VDKEIVLEKELEKHFQFTSFREGQKEIIQDVLNGKNVLGILPTGSGKSICYQLPSVLLEGLTIVISPLISLMIDQVKKLKAHNFKKVATLNSFMNPMERRRVINNMHQYNLLFVSPELLQQEHIMKLLQRLQISLFVIDEAHCISQWGHEFRPDYLRLSGIIEKLGNPTILALSATATPSVQEDIISSLKKTKMRKHVYPMDKPNISFCVDKLENEQEKIEKIVELLSTYRVPTLIYFSSRNTAENVAKLLSEKLKEVQVAFYHAGMEPSDRMMIQQQYMNDQLDVICCTSAFGMGIDKANTRLIIHYHVPLQLESFIQEIGRAGRDGKSSVSLLLFSRQDINMPSNIIKNELPGQSVLSIVYQYLHHLYNEGKDLPDEEVEIENILQINEIQWRFLRYQLEKHGIIKENKIIATPETWKDVFQSIFHIIKSRNKHKENKLAEMLKWIHDDNCLRQSLYKSFQPFSSQATYQCCSNCGFSWNEWVPEQTVTEVKRQSNWQIQLKRLLIGDTNETK